MTGAVPGGTEPPRLRRGPGGPGATTVRAALFGLLLAAAVVLAATVDPPGLTDVRGWLDDGGPAAWLLLVVGLAVALLTPAPRSALSVLVGAVAGFFAGLAVVVAAGVLGGLAGYGLSRWLGRPAVARMAGDRLLARLRMLIGAAC